MVAFLRLEKLRRPDALGAAALALAGHARRARRRARAQPRHAVVRLRDVGARDVVLEVDDVHLGPQLRRAQLAARRPRAAARARAPARVLEGREPRRSSTARRGVRSRVRYRGARVPDDNPRLVGALDAADPRLDPQPAHGPVHHRGLRARRRHPAAERRPDARRPLRRRRARCAAATPTPRASTRRARRRTSAAARASTIGPNAGRAYTTIHADDQPACRAPTTSG